jgi:hypothetical protein
MTIIAIDKFEILGESLLIYGLILKLMDFYPLFIQARID